MIDRTLIIKKIKRYFYGATFNKGTLDKFIQMLHNDTSISDKKIISSVINDYLRYSKSKQAYFFDFKSMRELEKYSKN